MPPESAVPNVSSNLHYADPATGVAFAVFPVTAQSPPPHRFWASPDAARWACHPRGVPEGLENALPVQDLSDEQAFLLMAATEGADWIDPPAPTMPCGGVVCWWRTAADGIAFGLGLHRFIVRLGPALPGQSRLEMHVYQGGHLGWQPAPRHGRLADLVAQTTRWPFSATFYELALALGAEHLAGHGLKGLCRHAADPDTALLAPRDQPVLCPGGYWPLNLRAVSNPPNPDDPHAQIDHRPAQRWCFHRWRQACRQHPGLRHLRAWLATDVSVDRRLSEQALLDAVAVGGRAVGDPRAMLGQAALLPANERANPHLWARRFLDGCLESRGTVALPSVAAARWWLALDERSVLRLCQARPLMGAWSNLALALLCDLMAPRGRLRVSRPAAQALGKIPLHFWLAWAMADNPAQWKALERASWNRFQREQGLSLDPFGKAVVRAREMVHAHPRAAANLKWAVQTQIAGIPQPDRYAAPGTISVADRVWQWLWLPSESDAHTLDILGRVDKNWRWGTLKAAHAAAQHAQDFRLSVDLAAASAKDRQWPCPVGKARWHGVDITAVCTRKGLELVGQRYFNCLRHDTFADAAFTGAKTGFRRFFVLATPAASALLEIEKSPDHAWRVRECRALANTPGDPAFLALACRLAAVYTRLWRARARGHRPLAPHPQAPVLPAPIPADHVSTVSRRLLGWLVRRAGARPCFTDGPSQVMMLTFEEFAAPDGMLAIWIDRARAHWPPGLDIRFRSDPKSLSGVRPVIHGPESDLAALVDVLARVWEEHEAATGEDFSAWYADYAKAVNERRLGPLESSGS